MCCFEGLTRCCQDLLLYEELRGDVGRDTLQILKHLNIVAPVRTTRAFTLYAHASRSGDVQEWARAARERRRETARLKSPAPQPRAMRYP